VAETPSIEVRHLRKVYGEVVAVDDLTFAVPRGAVLGLLGGNGAGKTTTISMLLGLLEPTAGEIQVLGIDMLRRRYAALPRMNFSSPYVDLPHRLTVRQNLQFYGRLYGVKNLRGRIDEIYAAATGKPVEEVHHDMERDRFFKADEAVEYGLIDRVLTGH